MTLNVIPLRDFGAAQQVAEWPFLLMLDRRWNMTRLKKISRQRQQFALVGRFC
jgi:hypothetical protein